MPMTRRQFAQSLGAGAMLLPFMRGVPRAATGPVRRLVIVTSIGVSQSFWLPQSAVGAPLVLPQAFAGLQPVIDQVTYVTGLGWQYKEDHSSPQTLTGCGFNNANQKGISIDQFIAANNSGGTKYPTLLLGVNEALTESHHYANGARMKPIIDPAQAFQQIFGLAAAAPPAAGTTALPRTNILNLVKSQIKQLQGALGKQGQARLDQHLNSLEQLQGNLTGAPISVGCKPGTLPNLMGSDPANNAAAGAVSQAMNGIVANALTCDMSRIIGMQFGKSNTAFCQYSAAAGIEEHSANHGGNTPQFTVPLLACEAYIGGWISTLATQLKATPDPLNSGTTMLDNTLIAWIRDMGDGPNHLQYNMPFALIGGKNYLKSGGTLATYGGTNDLTNLSGSFAMTHQRLLLNLAEYMGVTTFSNFGDFTKGGSATPLAEIKAT